jgi:hypothetical protein
MEHPIQITIIGSQSSKSENRLVAIVLKAGTSLPLNCNSSEFFAVRQFLPYANSRMPIAATNPRTHFQQEILYGYLPWLT